MNNSESIIVYRSRNEQIIDEYWNDLLIEHPIGAIVAATSFILVCIVIFCVQNRKRR